MPHDPLRTGELEERLEEYLDAVLSSRRTADGLARALSPFTREQQDFVLHWVGVIAKTNSEMGFQFANHAATALELMDLKGVEDWLIHAMDIYDRQGLYPGCAAFEQVERFASHVATRDVSVSLAEIKNVLEQYVRGLSGRTLNIATDEIVWTDTESLYLPEHYSVFSSRERNFQLYKCSAAYLWAQSWFGTFAVRAGAPVSISDVCGRFPDPGRALHLFEVLEAVRLNANIQRELPGLYREMCALQAETGAVRLPATWGTVRSRLGSPAATVYDTLDMLSQVYAPDGPLPGLYCYQGRIQPGRTETAMKERFAREKEQLATALAKMADALRQERGGPDRGRFTARVSRDPWSSEFRVDMEFDGKPVNPPADVRNLAQSIAQDFGGIPEEYLVPAEDGGYRPDARHHARDVREAEYEEEGAYVYNEWDYRRQHYRKDWCVLREIDVRPSDESFVPRTLERYAGLVADLRRTFEALRGEDRRLRKQKEGDDIDLDALVAAHADTRVGMELSERVFTRLQKQERNLAVVFMVDMSGSTKGWINDAERESLVLLCEALEILGDRYAIYGFSGMTRKRCELYRIKAFGDPYDELVHRRITGIRPQDYTRMGVVIRHLTRMLREVEARTKLLITLSDGKPDDYDGYRGEYGIEDTRQALIEAKYEGIHPFCITIDTAAYDYLPHMYGAVNYVLVDEVRKLPLKVFDIYRRLTT